ncbi:TPA_asm: hypothetical protein PROPHIFSQJ01-1_55 [Mycobacterium phage prophiFSQJ01-1]|nr:TPA_asm: hypothetical protein PROPHIFSQJ01-1_55 [Mycobacterium phage prophiFSQJ01-1]
MISPITPALAKALVDTLIYMPTMHLNIRLAASGPTTLTRAACCTSLTVTKCCTREPR